MFKLPETGSIPVLDILERIGEVFKGAYYEIVSDDEMPAIIPAECSIEGDGFKIKIRESIYDGAYEKEIGAFRDHILHEICHIFLYKMGYAPVMNRSFKNGQIKAYCSSEWQAKALCGELMMPYEETENMSVEEIQEKYAVSRTQAEYRKKY